MLFIIIGAVVLIGGGVGGYFALKGKPEEPVAVAGKGIATVATDTEKAAAKRDPKTKPTFVPLEPFTVNLADKENERYAQVTFSIEADSAATGDAVKSHMPAIRGRVLLTLSTKSAADLSGREGKLTLAKDILADARKAMDLPDDSTALIDVHFTNFVMQ